jgi:hypothetical protein
MTATVAGPELAERLNALCSELGSYPHAVLTEPQGRKRQTCRSLKLSCGCPRIIRASAQVAEGPPINCDGCGGRFAAEDGRASQPPPPPPIEPAARPDGEVSRLLAEFDLPADATLEDVKKRYRELAKLHHPDAQGGDDERMKAINAVHARLTELLGEKCSAESAA